MCVKLYLCASASFTVNLSTSCDVMRSGVARAVIMRGYRAPAAHKGAPNGPQNKTLLNIIIIWFSNGGGGC